MALREGPQVYLWEADMGQYYKKGPRVIPLDVKVALWKSVPHLIWKRSWKPVSNGCLLEIIVRLKDQELDMDFSRWLLGTPSTKRVYCSELIAQTLESLGRSVTVHSPKDFLTIEGYGLPSYVSW